ncbi:MAG: redox-sensing transcriptional repressor Rex [Oscillospiraceae bacterium]|jgi:redox-sensing transcriptional repressor|nr:redox-sensing transcriptional repressor Rex [Oscillospiraceae bacterium]
METNRIPDAVARRLPSYYRNLRELELAGVIRLSSQALGKRMGLTASQIRQDINCFGGFGQQGYGYHVPNLKLCIGQILGIDRMQRLVIVGAGNIGMAVANYPSFRNEGFRIAGLFDADPARIGQQVNDLEILPVESLQTFLMAQPIDIVIIATPARSAQGVLDIAAQCGVRGVWNFAPTNLTAPEGMEIANVHLSDSLMALSFRLHEREVRRQSLPWTQQQGEERLP